MFEFHSVPRRTFVHKLAMLHRCRLSVATGMPSTAACICHLPTPSLVRTQKVLVTPCIDHSLAHQRRSQGRVLLNGSSNQSNPVLTTDLDGWLRLLRQKRAAKENGPGHVFLVGTGPGDPELLTLKAYKLMQTADVVLYDRLVSEDILKLVHGNARMVYVGKQAGFHSRTQEEIHQLLLAFADAGATVLRLKGGDPYVFGRGGEEVQYLQAHGIHVHCVPGITAASGICAELGIPMTHRGTATSVRFLTGHAREGGEEQLDQTLSLVGDPHTTLVVYMGLGTLPALQQQLRSAGVGDDLPAVAVERGTTIDQRIVYGTLGTLSSLTHQAKLKSPTLLILGHVVALSPNYQQWMAAGQPLLSEAQRPAFEFGQALREGSLVVSNLDRVGAGRGRSEADESASREDPLVAR